MGAAHNDYLQLASEGGLLVGVPALIALLVVGRQIACRLREDEADSRAHWTRVGAVAGLVAIALQESVDFSLQIPGNAVLFALLCAIALHVPRDGDPAPRGTA